MEVKPGYKRTEAGIIPEDWNPAPVGQMRAEGRVTGKKLWR